MWKHGTHTVRRSIARENYLSLWRIVFEHNCGLKEFFHFFFESVDLCFSPYPSSVLSLWKGARMLESWVETWSNSATPSRLSIQWHWWDIESLSDLSLCFLVGVTLRHLPNGPNSALLFGEIHICSFLGADQHPVVEWAQYPGFISALRHLSQWLVCHRDTVDCHMR